MGKRCKKHPNTLVSSLRRHRQPLNEDDQPRKRAKVPYSKMVSRYMTCLLIPDGWQWLLQQHTDPHNTQLFLFHVDLLARKLTVYDNDKKRYDDAVIYREMVPHVNLIPRLIGNFDLGLERLELLNDCMLECDRKVELSQAVEG
ncbi:hypothetical protein Fot_22109 [Forsythia ovata]|uniref:Uncharacterized protein n=1 Tax=Forsythia ovata TaxID=205694 RepID=A0ABD1UXS9_9LAMI